MEKNILLAHGSGGKHTHTIISDLFLRYFENPVLLQRGDSAVLNIQGEQIAFTTDSYVVTPIFFPGGDIGKLSICGTVNDLAVSGAVPKYISAGFIIEEGFSMDELEKIVISMNKEAKKAEVLIVAGDTKVVSKGQCDKIFINTSGVGVLEKKYEHITGGEKIETGDKIIINGAIAQHGIAIMYARNFDSFRTDILSDCSSLNHLIRDILNTGARIKFLRDATRGGLATVLCEITQNRNFGIEVFEEKVPVDENVRGFCELLGLDPFYIANEGKIVVVVHPDDEIMVLNAMNNNILGKESTVIGQIVSSHPGKTVMQTSVGGRRLIDMLAGEQLPRIC